MRPASTSSALMLLATLAAVSALGQEPSPACVETGPREFECNWHVNSVLQGEAFLALLPLNGTAEMDVDIAESTTSRHYCWGISDGDGSYYYRRVRATESPTDVDTRQRFRFLVRPEGGPVYFEIHECVGSYWPVPAQFDIMLRARLLVGSLAASSPAGGPTDLHLLDAARDHRGPEEADLIGGWWDDPVLDDGIVEIGLAVPGLEGHDGTTPSNVAFGFEWALLGNRYSVNWSYMPPSVCELACALGGRADEEAGDPNWTAQLVRWTADGASVLMDLPGRGDPTAGIVKATVPVGAIGDPPPGALFSNFTARSLTFTRVAGFAGTTQAFPEVADEATESLRAFALGGPEVWDRLRGLPPRESAVPPATEPDAQSFPLLLLGLGLLGAGGVAGLLLRRRTISTAATAAAPPVPTPGEEFLGKYRVRRELGRGAFGSTWLAYHIALERPAVIKQLHPEWSGIAEARARFEREAKLLASIDHPRVTRIYDVERTASAWYLVMEYIDGGTLEERLQRGPLPIQEAVVVTLGILEGLEAIHRKGVLHRDIKPSNILLTRDGEPKVTDFGVARSTSPVGTRFTRPGSSTPGTPLFMAPEQVRGDEGDERSDLYAVAVTAYQLVTGRYYLPVRGKDEFQLRRAVVEDAPDLPVVEASDGVNAWLAKGLAKQPGDRFGSAAEMRRALLNASAR